jgi:hypothetical protein
MRYHMLMMGLMAAVLLAGQTWADQHQGQPVVTDAAALPLSKIVLYTSGVGYFERQGEVEGDQQLTLRFKTEDIKDLLKSLVVQDLDGGQVTAVTYDSRDPIAKSLKSFAIDLTDNPGMGALLQQLRGEQIELATPNSSRGRSSVLKPRRKRQVKIEKSLKQSISICSPRMACGRCPCIRCNG